jgi:hypothetical protein
MNHTPWLAATDPRKLESDACAAIVAFGGGKIARGALARALRAWRQRGNRVQAHWLQYHASFITGHLWKNKS